jgi:integrase
MNFVYPIKKKGDVKAMKKYLKKSNMRDYALFVLGINSALRVSDLLSFKVSDIMNPDGSIKERITLTEQKTKKSKSFPFNDSIKETMTEYLKTDINKDGVLFPSRIGDKDQAITRQYVHVFLKEAALAVGIKELISTHSMRKTFSYNIYQNNVKENPGIINTLQHMLNHKDSSTTLRYIGLTQDVMDDVYMTNGL